MNRNDGAVGDARKREEAQHSVEEDAPCISIWGHYDSHRFGRSRYCSRCGDCVTPPGHGVEDVDAFLTAYDNQPGIETTVLPPGASA